MPVDLGTASSFAVLGGGAVTGSAPPTLITGNLGSVGALTGFTALSTQVTGTTYAPGGSVVPVQATTDLAIAYADARDRALAPVTLLTNALIAAGPLPPGIYQSTPAITITSDITLDAQNDEDATFIFQVTGALNTTAGKNMNLINGAKASNVFWQAAGAVNLAATTVFYGTLLANGAAILGADATIPGGRVLTKTTAITLNSANIIASPAL